MNDRFRGCKFQEIYFEWVFYVFWKIFKVFPVSVCATTPPVITHERFVWNSLRVGSIDFTLFHFHKFTELFTFVLLRFLTNNYGSLIVKLSGFWFWFRWFVNTVIPVAIWTCVEIPLSHRPKETNRKLLLTCRNSWPNLSHVYRSSRSMRYVLGYDYLGSYINLRNAFTEKFNFVT